MLLLLDNYDSFTHILGLYFEELGVQVEIRRNDEVSIEEIRRLAPDQIVISPGPGSPAQSGISRDVVKEFAGVVPLLGVCLGHQIIAEHFGARIARAERAVHGKVSVIENDSTGVFNGLPSQLKATRYHSLSVKADTLPSCLKVTAWVEDSENGNREIMGIRHRVLQIEGVQFHPESVCTEHGMDMLRNFLSERVRVCAA